MSQYLRLGLHVSASNRAVVRAAWALLNHQGKSHRMRTARHQWLRLVLAAHHAAQAEYDLVMGRWW